MLSRRSQQSQNQKTQTASFENKNNATSIMTSRREFLSNALEEPRCRDFLADEPCDAKYGNGNSQPLPLPPLLAKVIGKHKPTSRLWFAKTLADFEINDIAALLPLCCYNS